MDSSQSTAGSPGNARLPDLGALTAVRTSNPQQDQRFQPLPTPTGAAPYHFDLATALGADGISKVQQAGKLVLHCVGDTGGVKNGSPQQIVVQHMEADLATGEPADAPRFFYHLGDVVYYYGEHENYYGQFYEPYSLYSAPVLPIPGNHDGDVIPHITTPSLGAFVENFCSTASRHTPEAGDSNRLSVTLPNVYWTLAAPFATFVGLYTNVPDGGRVDDDQKNWFINELRNAPGDRALVVALHHPPISLDTQHSGSAHMHTLLDDAVSQSGRTPDVVLSAHVHNYQRFTRQWNGREVPFIVAGAGGYFNLHYMSHALGWPIHLPFDVPTDAANGMQARLESYDDNHHGYLILELDKSQVRGTYFTVPRPQEPWRNPATAADSFALDLGQHSMVPSQARPPATGGPAGIG